MMLESSLSKSAQLDVAKSFCQVSDGEADEKHMKRHVCVYIYISISIYIDICVCVRVGVSRMYQNALYELTCKSVG